MRGGDPAASDACLAAATDLVSSYRYEQALHLIELGVACSDRSERKVDLLLLRGSAHLHAGDAVNAEAAYSEALAASEEPRQQSRARLGLAAARRITDKIDLALADVDTALQIAESEGLDEEAARAFGLRGNLLFPLGDAEGALAAQLRSLELARNVGSVELEAGALGGLGDVEYMRGRLSSAHARFSECVAMSRAHGLRRIEAANLPMQAITHLWKGDVRQTAGLAKEARRRCGGDRQRPCSHGRASRQLFRVPASGANR